MAKGCGPRSSGELEVGGLGQTRKPRAQDIIPLAYRRPSCAVRRPPPKLGITFSEHDRKRRQAKPGTCVVPAHCQGILLPAPLFGPMTGPPSDAS